MHRIHRIQVSKPITGQITIFASACTCQSTTVPAYAGDLTPGPMQDLEDALLQVLDRLNSSSSHGGTAAVQATLALTRMAGASS